jgi:O-antigen/teichoic acid export membrane protein
MRFTLIANLLSAAGAFGLTIIFSRSLHSEDFATIVVWSSLFTWGQYIVSLSSAGYVVRATITGGKNEGINSIATIVQYVAFISVLSAVVWFCIGQVMEGQLNEYSELFYYSCVLASLTATHSSLTGYYRCVEQHRVANFIQMLFSVGTLLISCLFLANKALDVVDRVRIPVIVLICIFLLYRPGVAAIIRRMKLKSLKEISLFLKYSSGFIGHSAAHTLVGGLDRLVLSGYIGSVELGNYHVIKQGAESQRIIAQAIQSHMAPSFLESFNAGETAIYKELTRQFVMYIAGASALSFLIAMILFFLSGREFSPNILVLCLILVVSNAVYSIFDFTSMSSSLGRGYGLSFRSMVVCSMYAIAIYLFQRQIDLIGMSLTYLCFTIALLLSIRFSLMFRDHYDYRI